jgi:hypothetical protein
VSAGDVLGRALATRWWRRMENQMVETHRLIVKVRLQLVVIIQKRRELEVLRVSTCGEQGERCYQPHSSSGSHCKAPPLSCKTRAVSFER